MQQYHPIRLVPLSIWVNVHLGGFQNQFGWAFFTFGMILVWNFIPHVDFSVLEFQGKLGRASGVVTSVRATNGEVINQPVFVHQYRFRAADGKACHDVSFAYNVSYPESSQVDVEYPADKPQHSRIVGMKRAPLDLWLGFVLIFPAIGLVFLIVGFNNARKNIGLLHTGVLTTGRASGKRGTNLYMNESKNL